MTPSDLTVILCTFNMGTGSRKDGGAFLPTCIESFFATRSDAGTGIIAVDDGSDDDTPKILARYPIDLHIRLSENGGLRDAFSMAVHYVKTRYFLRVDGDIVFTTPGWDARLVQHMERHPECGVCGATQIARAGRVHSAGDRLWPKYEHIRERIAGEFRVCDSVMGCFSCFRMAAWDKVGGLTAPKWLRSETEDMNLRISKAGYQVHCLPFEFEHHHWEARKKGGRYNDKECQRLDIQAYMAECHGVDFYGLSIVNG